MAYRGDDAGDALEAPTAEGALRVELGPRSVKLAVGQRSLQIAERFATLQDHKRKLSLKIEARLFIARDVPREDLGVWIELLDAKGPGMRRIFGVQPVSLLEETGLHALASLDRVAHRLRSSLAELALSRARSDDVRRAVELGRGLDKVLLVDHGDRYVIYARRLFRDRARFTMAIHDDGRIVVPHGSTTREIVVRSRFGITVWGDCIRFADRHGTDLAKVSIPWIAPEDRLELARRISQLVDLDGSFHPPP